MTVVGAWSGARRLTLDPLSLVPVTLDVREVESTIPCGFQVEWVHGDVDGDPIEVCSGAGFASYWMTVTFRGRSYALDVREFVQAFVAALPASASTGDGTGPGEDGERSPSKPSGTTTDVPRTTP